MNVNGTTVDLLSASTGSFQFVVEPIDFTAVATIGFDNQGVADGATAASGTLVARHFDLQFSAVPEPGATLLAALGLATCGSVRRRK